MVAQQPQYPGYNDVSIRKVKEVVTVTNNKLKMAITVEKTLALIKPNAMMKSDEIIEVIKRRGYTIVQVRP